MELAGKIARWFLAAVGLCVAILYTWDYISVQNRMAHKTSADPVESRQVRPVYAVARKDGKAEFDFGDTQTETCVHSIFPHDGYSPCWYLNRQDQKPIPIGTPP